MGTVGCLLLAALAVSVDDQGSFSVLRDGKAVVSSLVLECGTNVVFRKSFVRQDDGTKVWNQWSEDPETSARLEVAERPDGAVEVTMAGKVAFNSANNERSVVLTVPAAVMDGKPYSSIVSNARKYAAERGVLSAKTKSVM